MRDRPREGRMEGRRGAGKRRASVGRVLKSLENCGRDCGNPVICGAKAGHSSDLGAQMLSRLCLFCSCSFHSPLPSLPTAPYLTLFSQLHWMSGGVVLARPNSQFTVLTHSGGYLQFRQNKRLLFFSFFSFFYPPPLLPPATTWTSRPSHAS